MSKKLIKKMKFWVLVVFCLIPFTGKTQTDSLALKILDKAMGPVGSLTQSMSVYFEGIAMNVQDAKSIFSLPAYKVYRGGFFISEGNKFEMQLGIMKALSDGKLMVIVDEISKSLIVDSVRDLSSDVMERLPDIEKLMDENGGDMIIKYSGKEIINGKNCHKIKGEFPKDSSKHIYYWVRTDNNQLVLIGEWQGNAYDAYWIKSISSAPKGHKYSVNLPNKYLENFYGYQVFDFRFISKEN